MKKILNMMCVSVLSVSFISGVSAKENKTSDSSKKNNTQEKVKASQPISLNTQLQKLSYTIGYQMGLSLIKQNIEIEPKTFSKGLEDGTKQIKPMLNEQQMRQVMDQFKRDMLAKMQTMKEDESQKNLEASQAFLKDNQTKEGVKTLPSGLQYRVIKEGSGEAPKSTDIVEVNYEGKLINGKVFDSSYKRGESARLPVNAVIKGWQEALQMMKPGAEWEIFVPPQLAYGQSGAAGVIGPNQALIFKIELLKVDKSS